MTASRRAGIRLANDEPLMSMTDVADRLGVPLDTFRRWRKHGRGPQGYRLGKHVQFRWSEVEAWLQQRREQPADPVRLVHSTNQRGQKPA